MHMYQKRGHDIIFHFLIDSEIKCNNCPMARQPEEEEDI